MAEITEFTPTDRPGYFKAVSAPIAPGDSFRLENTHPHYTKGKIGVMPTDVDGNFVDGAGASGMFTVSLTSDVHGQTVAPTGSLSFGPPTFATFDDHVTSVSVSADPISLGLATHFVVTVIISV